MKNCIVGNDAKVLLRPVSSGRHAHIR